MPLKDPEKRREYHRIYMRERYQRDPKAGAERARKARQADPEKARAQLREYRAKNPKKSAEWNRRWHREHPEAKVRWAKKNPFVAWAMCSNGHHRKAGYIVKITTRELAAMAEKTPMCHYCGTTLDYTLFKGMHLENSATADRLNNESILDLNNVQIICLSCNRRKRKRPHLDFLEHLGKKMEVRI